MSTPAWKKGVERVLLNLGFQKIGKTYRRETSEVAVLFAVEKGFDNQWHFNVGFWLMALGGIVPDSVESTHMYFRLERLFPQHRDTILMAGSAAESEQQEAIGQLGQLLIGPMESRFCELSTTNELRKALQSGQLDMGLMRKEAREYLTAG